MQKLTTQAVVILVYVGLCSSLFYTNSRENDFPRMGKRPSFFVRAPNRPNLIHADALYGNTKMSDGREKYPLVETSDDLDFLQEAQMDSGIDSPTDVDATSVDRSPRQGNKIYVMYDDSEHYKDVLRKFPWPIRHRQPVWE